MAGRHLHIDLFVKVRVYEGIYGIVLNYFQVKTSGDSHESPEATSGQGRGIRILFGSGLLVSAYYKAHLIFLEAPVFIELIDVDLYTV